MKILVLSDSHGVIDYMAQAVEREQPQQIFFLGDVLRDVSKLREKYPDLPMALVRGNCDQLEREVPEERELLLEGKRFWLLHGHTYWVKSGTGILTEEARARGVDVVCFGHTHLPHCEREGRLWVLNPGTSQGWPAATYGVIQLTGGEISCRIEKLR